VLQSSPLPLYGVSLNSSRVPTHRLLKNSNGVERSQVPLSAISLLCYQLLATPGPYSDTQRNNGQSDHTPQFFSQLLPSLPSLPSKPQNSSIKLLTKLNSNAQNLLENWISLIQLFIQLLKTSSATQAASATVSEINGTNTNNQLLMMEQSQPLSITQLMTKEWHLTTSTKTPSKSRTAQITILLTWLT
jgi:hypothetical protein